MNEQVVCIVGLGYVGLPLALLARKKGYKVIGFDINEEKISRINQGICPFKDSHLQQELDKYPIEATTDVSQVSKAEIIIICVPTPVLESRLPDYRPIEMVCKSVSGHISAGQLLILESTVNPGVCEELVLPLIESGSGLTCGIDFSLAHCPERINPGDNKWMVGNIPRVVGGFDKESLARAMSFYSSIIEAEIKPMRSLKEAEAVKMVENSFRNVNIAFVNELAKSFSKMEIDLVNVINGASTKPFSFMPHFPGCGIGGHCIPIDPYFLIDYAKRNGFDHDLLRLSCSVNESMPLYTVELLEETLRSLDISLSGSTIALLGLSYKADVDDFRESPAFEIIQLLQLRGAKTNIFDPFCLEKSNTLTLDAALNSADAVLITVGHKQFQAGLNLETLVRSKIKVVIDGRNCIDKSLFENSGIIYKGIGR